MQSHRNRTPLKVLVVAAVWAVGAIAASAGAASVPFNDSFNDANGSQSGFTVFTASGVAAATSSTAFAVNSTTATFNGDAPFNSAISAGMQFGNVPTTAGTSFVEKIAVTPTTAGLGLNGDFFGLGALGQSADLTNADATAANNTFYLADIQGNNGIRILRFNSGTSVTVASGTMPSVLALNTTYTLTLTGSYSATGLTLQFNATDGASNFATITGAVDTSPLNGQFFGLRDRNGNASGTDMVAAEDNFSLTPEPASLAVLGLGGMGLLLRRRQQ